MKLHRAPVLLTLVIQVTRDLGACHCLEVMLRDAAGTDLGHPQRPTGTVNHAHVVTWQNSRRQGIATVLQYHNIRLVDVSVVSMISMDGRGGVGTVNTERRTNAEKTSRIFCLVSKYAPSKYGRVRNE